MTNTAMRPPMREYTPPPPRKAYQPPPPKQQQPLVKRDPESDFFQSIKKKFVIIETDNAILDCFLLWVSGHSIGVELHASNGTVYNPPIIQLRLKGHIVSISENVSKNAALKHQEISQPQEEAT